MNHAIEILQNEIDRLVEDNKQTIDMLHRAEKAVLSHQKSFDYTNERIKDLHDTISRLEDK